MKKRRMLLLTVAAVCMLSTASLADTYTILRYNDSGSAVQQLQNALNQLGYSVGSADGKYGSATEKAVRQFQQDHSLKVDGKAGQQTQALVYQLASGSISSDDTSSSTSTSTSTNTSSYFSGNYDKLEYGSKGARVTKLQQALNQLGFSAGKADGRYGAGTQQAVTAFQRAQGLSVDGKAGKQTLQRIEQVLSGEVSNTTAEPTVETVTATPAPTATPNAYGTVPTRTLRKGYQGTDVKSVQTRLKTLGYYKGSVDGKYGTGTMAAVSAFQSANGLNADGLAGTSTYKVLYSDAAVAYSAAATATPAPTSTVPSRTLRSGDSGTDVKNVQTRLKELGYYSGSVDGKYGTGTVSAVVSFQTANSLKADGAAGTSTYKVLFSDSAKEYTVTATATATATTTATTVTATKPSRTLRSGDTGDDVKSVQTRLKELGYYSGSVDGKYGSGTVSAVVSFQSSNGLTMDGVAGSGTYKILYSTSAKTASEASSSSASTATATAPDKSKIKLMYWYTEVKPLLKGKSSIYVYEPVSKIGFTLHLYSLGRHADVEPMTADDTAKMMEAWGGVADWTPKFVYVLLPNGQWTVATMHNVAHGGQSIKDNNFDGQNCVHFLREMSECEANDPKYGVTNQKILREGWKALTGETVN